jgi:deoxyribose-phosphate aldolase
VIRGLGHVELINVEERAARLREGSIETMPKQQLISAPSSAVRSSTPTAWRTVGKVRRACARAIGLALSVAEIPSTTAVSVYPSPVTVAREALEGTGLRTGSVT